MLRRTTVLKNLKRKGAALVEYALLIAGVALISAAAVSLFGHKTSDMIATVAAVLPGAHSDDNGPVQSGHLIETTGGTTTDMPGTGITLDTTAIVGNSGTQRLNQNVFGGADQTTGNELVVESK